MFVACRVESEEECKAAAAVLPQIIGNIQTAIGCATLGRASGIAVQAMAGDPVFQGDVIETATDGRIGIRFIDGTVFNLSGGTRVVLDEFACDARGIPHAALFAVTRGTFAFIAGEVAKTGSLRIGKRADVVLWNGNPFSVYTRPQQVWIDGALMYDMNNPRLRPVSDFELGQPGEGDTK